MPLKNMGFLDPKKKESKHLETKAMTVAKKMPNIVWHNDQAQFRVEFREYKMLDLGRSSQAHDVKPHDLISYWNLL